MKTSIIGKVASVIDSCETIEHTLVASKYLSLARKQNLVQDVGHLLHDSISCKRLHIMMGVK